jgi:HPt (histidine-containing phosphotransfer) domain-containing protein
MTHLKTILHELDRGAYLEFPDAEAVRQQMADFREAVLAAGGTEPVYIHDEVIFTLPEAASDEVAHRLAGMLAMFPVPHIQLTELKADVSLETEWEKLP